MISSITHWSFKTVNQFLRVYIAAVVYVLIEFKFCSTVIRYKKLL